MAKFDFVKKQAEYREHVKRAEAASRFSEATAAPHDAAASAVWKEMWKATAAAPKNARSALRAAFRTGEKPKDAHITQMQTGKRGGRFYLNASGKKVYLKG